MSKALQAPTAASLQHFVDFAARFRRLAMYNLKMVYIQRPGAGPVGTLKDWQEVGQRVLADAVPIVLLRTFGPIELVYELADTVPRVERDPRHHVAAVEGAFDERWLAKLIDGVRHPTETLSIEVTGEVYGAHLFGTAASARLLPEHLRPRFNGTSSSGDIAHGVFETERLNGPKTAFRIKLNRRLTPPEQFAVHAHELGHILCGHQGGYAPRGRAGDESGWPERRGLPHCVREIEAEMVAWLVCSRLGLTTGAPIYLRPHLEKAEANGEAAKVSLDAIISATARIERYMKVRR